MGWSEAARERHPVLNTVYRQNAKDGCYDGGDWMPDWCLEHNAYWAYDERVCHLVIHEVYGQTPRRPTGDGRQDGAAVFPIRNK